MFVRAGVCGVCASKCGLREEREGECVRVCACVSASICCVGAISDDTI